MLHLLFKKTYGCSANFSTKSLKMQYGDGYYTNVTPNINNLNSNFSLNYDGLSDIQSKALIGFFQNTFEYTPLNTQVLFFFWFVSPKFHPEELCFYFLPYRYLGHKKRDLRRGLFKISLCGDLITSSS